MSQKEAIKIFEEKKVFSERFPLSGVYHGESASEMVSHQKDIFTMRKRIVIMLTIVGHIIANAQKADHPRLKIAVGLR